MMAASSTTHIHPSWTSSSRKASSPILSDTTLLEGTDEPSHHSSDGFLSLRMDHADLLIGRETETSLLESAFDRVCNRVQQAPSEIVLVQGESGSGKSHLIQSCLQQCSQREDMGIFVEGKFDQYNSTPYAAIVQAATALCKYVSDSPYAEDVREHLEVVLEQERQLLFNLFPDIQLILCSGDGDDWTGGTVEPPAGFTTEYSLMRFLKVFCTFWNAVASVHPIILFLDDLQWADPSSQEFFSSMAVESASTNILLVGAYRTGGFQLNLEDSKFRRMKPLRISNLSLDPLSPNHVAKIIAHATERNIEDCRGISQLIHAKTNGNVYFCWQFLAMMQSSGLIEFSFRSNQWEWDLVAIADRCDVADNVAELLMRKLTSLSPQAQTILMLAACLGHSFDRGMLEGLVLSSRVLDELCSISIERNLGKEESFFLKEWSDKELERALEDVTNAGLIENTHGERLKFSHDCVQQVALRIVPNGLNVDMLHACLGEHMLELSNGANGSKDWMLFFSAIELLTMHPKTVEYSTLSRVDLASLCLQASVKSIDKSAFISGATYADRGYKLLDPPTRWTINYSLCLRLCTLSAEMHRCHGNYKKAIEASHVVTAHALSMEDKFTAQNVMVGSLLAQSLTSKAKHECLRQLSKLGIDFPEHAKKFHLLVQYVKVRRLLRGRQPGDLFDLPRCKDVFADQASHLLQTIGLIGWNMNDGNMILLSCLIMMTVTLRRGIGRYSNCVFASFGTFLAHIGKLREAHDYGNLALALKDRNEISESSERTLLIVYSFLFHLKEPIHGSLGPMMEGHEQAMKVGQMNVAVRCLVVRSCHGFFGSMTLDHLETQIRSYCNFFRDFRIVLDKSALLPLLQVVLNLMGKSEESSLVMSRDPIEDEEAFIVQQAADGDNISIVHWRNFRTVRFVIMDELELADEARRRVLPELPSTLFSSVCHTFFCALVCLGRARSFQGSGCYIQSRKYRREANVYRKKIQAFVRNGSVNCVPFEKLLRAETLALRYHKRKASLVKAAYEEAICSATMLGFRLCKAMAYERTGEYMLEMGDSIAAISYLRNAWVEYSEFGAVAKLDQMSLKYGNVCSFDEKLSRKISRPSLHTKPHTLRYSSRRFLV